MPEEAVGQAAVAASTPATPSGDTGASSGQQPQQGGQQGVQQSAQENANIRQLREAYDGIKKDLESWTRYGVRPEQIGQFQGVYGKVYTQAAELGRSLGYPDDEIAEALAEDPVKTIDFLRGEAQRARQGQQSQAGGQQDLNALVQQQVEQALGPINERENLRLTNDANSLFERTVRQAAVDSFKAEGIDVANIPQDEMFMLMSATSEILKYDDASLHALKYEGKTAPIQKAFQEARTYLDKYYMARSGRERGVQRPGGPARPAAPNRKPSLDEMINNPAVIDEAQGRTGASRHYAG